MPFTPTETCVRALPKKLNAGEIATVVGVSSTLSSAVRIVPVPEMSSKALAVVAGAG
jgi:hypothetical protein